MFNSIGNFIFYHTPVFLLIQSIWRDEAFSYFMAKPPVIQIIINTANDFNPPLYYIFLHFWVIIVGKSDELLRILSFIFYLLTIFVAYKIAKKITDNKFAYFVALFTMFNPMLLYYAFEIRMYSLFALLTLTSFYFLYVKNWKGYSLSVILGLYTHTFFLLIPFSYASFAFIHGKWVNEAPRAYARGILKFFGERNPPKHYPSTLLRQAQDSLRVSAISHSSTSLHSWFSAKADKRKEIINIIKPYLFFLPWMPIVIKQFIKSRDSWLFPVDFQLIKSVLGNLFTNYEGTPGNWWSITFILSLLIVFFMILSLRKRRKLAISILFPIFLSLTPILIYSVAVKPVYVNRYLIFITVFEILSISLGIYNILNHRVRLAVSILWLFSAIIFNIQISPFHKKTDFKSLFNEINNHATTKDFVFTRTPIAYLESAYYYKYPLNTFIYNPNNISIPNYIGVTLIFPDVSRINYYSNARNFLVNDDATYQLIINN